MVYRFKQQRAREKQRAERIRLAVQLLTRQPCECRMVEISTYEMMSGRPLPDVEVMRCVRCQLLRRLAL